MAQRLLIFDLNSLVKLLTHYTEGAIPLDAEALTFEVSPKLQRYISMQLQSKEWHEDVNPQTGELEPIHVRYEGNRVLTIQNPQTDEIKWTDENFVEAPRRQ